MGKWVQKHKNSYDLPDAQDIAAEDAERQAKERRKRDRERAYDEIEGCDELLAEIDAVLEENAEGFVAAFVQKGGE